MIWFQVWPVKQGTADVVLPVCAMCFKQHQPQTAVCVQRPWGLPV